MEREGWDGYQAIKQLIGNEIMMRVLKRYKGTKLNVKQKLKSFIKLSNRRYNILIPSDKCE